MENADIGVICEGKLSLYHKRLVGCFLHFVQMGIEFAFVQALIRNINNKFREIADYIHNKAGVAFENSHCGTLGTQSEVWGAEP